MHVWTELGALNLIALPSDQAAQVDELLAQIKNELNAWTTRGFLTVAFQRDSNIGSIPQTGAGVSDSEDYPYQRADSNFTASATVRSQYDLGNQAKDSVYYQISGSRTVGDASKLKDMASGSLMIGTAINYGLSRVNVYAQTTKLDRDPVVRRLDPSKTKIKRDAIHTRSVGTSWSRPFKTTSVQTSYLYSRSDYMGRPISNNSDSKTHALSGSMFHTLSDSAAVFGGLGVEWRRAKDRVVPSARASQDRAAFTINGDYVYIPLPHQRVTLSAKFRRLDYKEPLSPETKIRDDRELTLSAAYVISWDAVSVGLKDWELGFSVSRTKNESNIAAYDIKNNYLGMSLTYTF